MLTSSRVDIHLVHLCLLPCKLLNPEKIVEILLSDGQYSRSSCMVLFGSDMLKSAHSIMLYNLYFLQVTLMDS